MSATANLLPLHAQPDILYGSSAYANNSSTLSHSTVRDYAQQKRMLCPAFSADPAFMAEWQPIEAELALRIGRSPEIFALTTYDALWVMMMAYVESSDPSDLTKFKASFETLTETYEGITGLLALDAAGDRKYASFNFWGVEGSGGEYTWKSFGHYNNATGELVID